MIRVHVSDTLSSPHWILSLCHPLFPKARRIGAATTVRRSVGRRAALASLATQPVGGSALESLNAYGAAVDVSLHPQDATGAPAPSACVNAASMLHAFRSSDHTGPVAEAVYAHLSREQWAACLQEPGYSLWSCVLDTASANEAARLAGEVTGRVVVATRARHAHDEEGLVRWCEHMLDLAKSVGVKQPHKKLLFRIPATYEGLAAVERLESRGTAQCDVSTACRAHIQAAVNADASSVTVQVGAADALMGEGAGVALVAEAYERAEKVGGKSKVCAASVRSADKAAALCGADFVLLPQSIIAELAQRPPVPRTVGGHQATDNNEATLSLPVDGGRAALEAAAGSEATRAGELGVSAEAEAEKEFAAYMCRIYASCGEA